MLRSPILALILLISLALGSETPPNEACAAALGGMSECALSDNPTVEMLENACTGECASRLQTIKAECPPEYVALVALLDDVCAQMDCNVPLLRMQEECQPGAEPSVQITCTASCLSYYEAVNTYCKSLANAAIDAAAQLQQWCVGGACFQGFEDLEAACNYDDFNEEDVCGEACSSAASTVLSQCDPSTLPDEAKDELSTLEFMQGLCATPQCRESYFYVTRNCDPDKLDPNVLCTAECFSRVATAMQHCPAAEEVKEAYDTCAGIACEADKDCPQGLACSCASSRALLFAKPPTDLCRCVLP